MYRWVYGAIVAVAFLPMLSTLVFRRTRFASSYWAGARTWLPGYSVAAGLLAMCDVFAVSEHWWTFDIARYFSGVVLILPIEEWLFFVGAIFFIRALYVNDFGQDIMAKSGRVARTLWWCVLLMSIVLAFCLHSHPRSVFEFGIMLPVILLGFRATDSFCYRNTWVRFAVAYPLVFGMDTLMNAIHAFQHTRGVGSGLLVGTVPLEDTLAYIPVLLMSFVIGSDLVFHARDSD